MLERRIISLTRSLYLSDEQLKGILGEGFPVEFIREQHDNTFPHISHSVRLKSDHGDPVFFGNYTVNVLDEGTSFDKIFLAAHRITVLLHKYHDFEAGGGLRFTLRDRQTIPYDKWNMCESLLFSFRGMDTQLVSDSLP